MSTVVLVNAYEFDYLGTRLLASWLLQNSFSTHCILLDTNIPVSVNYPQENFIGYQYYTGYLTEHRAMHHPLMQADWEALARTIAKENPKILGFSARSTNNFLIQPVITAFKKAAPNALLIAGGYGPTLEPNLYLTNGFDVVVRGDGEEAILELAQCFESGDYNSMHKIANTTWNPNHGGQVNPLRDQQKNLSRYPSPLSGNEYFTWIQDGRSHRHEDPVLHSGSYHTFLGRGCPGKCTYCSGGHWKSLYHNEGKKAYVRRNREIESVIEECRKLPDAIKTIVFCDEYWSLPKKKTAEFLTLYKKYINKKFFAYFSYEQMVQNPDLMDLAIDAGLEWTSIGFQTGSPDLLTHCYERQPHYPVLISYAQRLFENFVHFRAQFIGGNCYETREDLEKTMDLIRALPVSLENPHSVTISNIRLRPHPESPIIKAWPKVVSAPMPADEWYFRAILMQYCRFFTPEEFSSLLVQFEDKKWNDTAERNIALENFLQNKFQEKQRSHYQALLHDTAGQPWVYYGAGDCFAKNQKAFSGLNPEALIVDKEYLPAEKHIAGIPVLAVEDFFNKAHEDEINYMVFLKHPLWIQRKLLRQYGVPFHRIHSCSTVLNLDSGS